MNRLLCSGLVVALCLFGGAARAAPLIAGAVVYRDVQSTGYVWGPKFPGVNGGPVSLGSGNNLQFEVTSVAAYDELSVILGPKAGNLAMTFEKPGGPTIDFHDHRILALLTLTAGSAIDHWKIATTGTISGFADTDVHVFPSAVEIMIDDWTWTGGQKLTVRLFGPLPDDTVGVPIDVQEGTRDDPTRSDDGVDRELVPLLDRPGLLVPEPGTVALITLALGGLAAVRTRRR